MQRRNGKSFAHRAFQALAAVATLTFWTGETPATEAVSFEGKTVTIVIGSAPGGTTDASARLMAAGLSKHLPGKPSVVVQSKPGAHSLTAMNYFAEQVKPDGYTLAVG